MKTTTTTLFLSFCITCLSAFAQNTDSHKQVLPLIPYPTHLTMGNQEQFLLSTHTQLKVEDGGRFANEIFYLQSLLKPALGTYLSPSEGANVLEFDYSDRIANEEGYSLTITKQKITVEARSSAGAFYAIQTLRQLLPVAIETGKKINTPLYIPSLAIEDQPAFEWRGMMIDVSRHFFSINYLKKCIDRLSLYKMNKLHLHLSDDQGWRIEIKKYPKLTEQSAWRTYDKNDSLCIRESKNNPDFAIDARHIVQAKGKDDMYGGYYTQEQIKDLVKYASAQHVELIPEIDMPGHMRAAIAAYPFLVDQKAGWGKQFSIPLCPGKDSTYVFVRDVLTEIMNLFPSPYIHIGADEVEKTSWKESDLCKNLMHQEGIKDYDALQSYFIKRVQNFVESKGKKLMTWDESLEGGVNSDVNIMYWRGWHPEAPQKAVNNGNMVVMSPTNPLYFDYQPDKSSLYNVYHLKVIYDDVPKEKAGLIKGAQANMWSERIPSEKRADYMLFPRLTALAERVWTNQDLFESYSKRILEQFPRLEAMGINYRLPDISGFAMENVYIKETQFDVKSPLDGAHIYYTTNGDMPSMQSTQLNAALKIDKPTHIKFALYSPNGIRGDIYTVNYKPTTMGKAEKKNNKPLVAGLNCDFYKAYFKNTKAISGTPDKYFVANNLAAPEEARAPSFGLKFDGYINIPQTGIYTFYFTCDDGGVLYIDNKVAVDNDGLHTAIEKSGQVALEKGLHPIKLDFIEGGGGFTLRVKYSLNGESEQEIPDSWFVHCKE